MKDQKDTYDKIISSLDNSIFDLNKLNKQIKTDYESKIKSIIDNNNAINTKLANLSGDLITKIEKINKSHN